MRRYNDGYSPEMQVCQYPTLPVPLVYKVIALYLEDRTQVDAYVAACQAELDRQREASPRELGVRAR